MSNKKVGRMYNITLQTCQHSKSIILFVAVHLKISRILFSLCPDHRNITVKTQSFKFLISFDHMTRRHPSYIEIECILPKVTRASLIYTQQKNPQSLNNEKNVKIDHSRNHRAQVTFLTK